MSLGPNRLSSSACEAGSFAFAGIFEEAVDRIPRGYCILTVTPNELMSRIHDRMPVILDPASATKWIGDEPLAESQFKSLTSPFPADQMEAWPVAALVNSPRNDVPECSVPIQVL